MRTIVAAMSLLVVFGSAGLAQTGSKGSTTSGQSAGTGTVLPAPVGHRQPRADEVPSEKGLSDPNSPANKEDAALDKKIKSICRGC
jgi:hypothetical protein